MTDQNQLTGPEQGEKKEAETGIDDQTDILQSARKRLFFCIIMPK